MKNTKKILALLLVFALLFSITGCGNSNEAASDEDNKEKVLVIAQEDIKVPLDTQLTFDSYVAQISRLITQPLLAYSEDMELQPLLLKELPKVSEDGLTYSFELKPDIKFHNGEVLKSSDVKYTYERMLKPSTKAVAGFLIEDIEGAKEIEEGTAEELKGFKIIDETKFEITLSEPFAPFLACLSTNYLAIYPEKACEEAGSEWGINQYIGTGPFKLAKNDKGIAMTLAKNEEYFEGPKNLDKIVFKFIADPNTAVLEFEKGNVDIVELQAKMYPQYASDEKFKSAIQETTPLAIAHMKLNTNLNPAFKDVRVRKAYSLAIDREKLCNTVLEGVAEPATNFLPKGIAGHDETAPVVEYDPEEAKRLLKEAGYENGVDIEFWQYEMTRFSDVMIAIQAQLKEVGINLKITNVDTAVWKDAYTKGNVEVMISHWFADFPDADNFLYTSFYSENSHGMFKDPEVDKLLIEARKLEDPAKRAELYKKVDHKLVREVYADVPLYYDKIFYLVQDRVGNMTPLFNDSVLHPEDADIVTK